MGGSVVRALALALTGAALLRACGDQEGATSRMGSGGGAPTDGHAPGDVSTGGGGAGAGDAAGGSFGHDGAGAGGSAATPSDGSAARGALGGGGGAGGLATPCNPEFCPPTFGIACCVTPRGPCGGDVGMGCVEVSAGGAGARDAQGPGGYAGVRWIY